MKQPKITTKKAFIICLYIVMFFAGLHLLDVGDILYSVGKRGCNGIWCLNPYLMYHIGAYLMVTAFLLSIFSLIWWCSE